jgi:hypothetical protein
MIIELKKKLSLENVDWYYVFKDDICVEATTELVRAENVYNKLKEDAAKYQEVVLKREEININSTFKHD